MKLPYLCTVCAGLTITFTSAYADIAQQLEKHDQNNFNALCSYKIADPTTKMVSTAHTVQQTALYVRLPVAQSETDTANGAPTKYIFQEYIISAGDKSTARSNEESRVDSRRISITELNCPSVVIHPPSLDSDNAEEDVDAVERERPLEADAERERQLEADAPSILVL